MALLINTTNFAGVDEPPKEVPATGNGEGSVPRPDTIQVGKAGQKKKEVANKKKKRMPLKALPKF